MVKDRAEVRLRSVWVPTRASGERMLVMNLEFNVNQVPKDSRLSLAEMALVTGDVETTLSEIPPAVPPEIKRKLRRLLRPWPEGRYTWAYTRSGGILNLFTPAWDEVWAGMVAGWEATTYPEEKTRQAALRELEQRWNRTPHPFFAGLTPAQVIVGGGPREEALTRQFLDLLSGQLDGQEFVSEGEALNETVMLLRGWQCEVGRGGTIRDEIVAERDELLARRARLLEEAAGSR